MTKPGSRPSHQKKDSNKDSRKETGPQAFLKRIAAGQHTKTEDVKTTKSVHLKSKKPSKTKQPEAAEAYEGRKWQHQGKRSKKKSNAARNRALETERVHVKKKPNSRLIKLAGEIQKNQRGFAFLLQEGEDVFISPQFAQELMTGDSVEIDYDTKRSQIHSLRVTKRAVKRFIGTFQQSKPFPIVILADKSSQSEVVIKEVSLDVQSEYSKQQKPVTNDKVLVEITAYEPRLEGKVLENYGPTLTPKFDTLSVVVKSQWPQTFSDAAHSEASNLSREIQKAALDNNYKGRRDFRDKHFLTIDGADARDFDDAILVERTEAGYVLYVAIADVSEFVSPKTVLDREAYERATSVYFPEWVIPMLPESLSNGACSLRPNEDKLTLTCEVHYDRSGRKKSVKVYETVIHSKRRCIYEDVQKEIEAKDPFWTHYYDLFKLIKTARHARGALDLDLPESKVVLDATGDTIGIVKRDRLDAHRLIEEFMIAANESVTELMEREGWPFVFRIHEPPKPDALNRFEMFAKVLGLKPNLGDGTNPKYLSRFIESIATNPLASTLYYLMLRSLKQAKYSVENRKHFGLASKAYTHFTSPIRRYPDLMVHRLLKRYCRHERFTPDEAKQYLEYLKLACDYCSKQERKAEELDRTVIKVKKARFMEKHYGEEFVAKVTNVSNSGLFIELQKYFVEGMVPIDELGDDYFEFIESRLLLKGKRTGLKYKIGQEITVQVLKIDLEFGLIDFSLITKKEDHENRKKKHSSH